MLFPLSFLGKANEQAVEQNDKLYLTQNSTGKKDTRTLARKEGQGQHRDRTW